MTSPTKRPWFKKKRFIIPAVLLLLIIISSAFSGGGDDDDGDVVAGEESSTTTTSETDDSSQTTAGETTTTERETTTTVQQTTTTVAPTTTALPPPRVYEGTGDFVIQDLEFPGGEEVGIGTITHAGSSNFIVRGLDSNLQQTELYVNTIGGYAGNLLLNSPGSFSGETMGLEITADGAWRIEIKTVQYARQFGQEAISGTGDDVLTYIGDITTAQVTNSGSSNFIIYSNGELLVNEIGPYEGVIRWPEIGPYEGVIRWPGPAVIEITAEGPWTISPQ